MHRAKRDLRSPRNSFFRSRSFVGFASVEDPRWHNPFRIIVESSLRLGSKSTLTYQTRVVYNDSRHALVKVV
jgi:hypothetical protein